MPATVLIVATALASLLVVGLPVRRLLRPRRPLDERAWLEAPFVGLATIVLVLQNLVYLDVPLRRSVPWFWLAVGLLWLAVLLRRGMRGSWAACPGGVLAACVGVYLLQGVGLLLTGAPRYLGNYMDDQFNYITIAEFLTDHPFSSSPEALGPRPYLLNALRFKDDRIGQSVLHGLLAVSSGQEAGAVYEATSLLGPALLVIPFFWLGLGLGQTRRSALVLGATAGLLPAVTQLHLEGFLSQTLMLPMLFALLVTLQRALLAPSVERVFVAMLLTACAAGVYTEFLPVLAGLLLVLLAGALLARRSWAAGGAVGLAVVLAPALLNPGALRHLLPGFRRLSERVFPEFFRSRLPALPELVWLGEEPRHLGLRHGMRLAGTLLLVPAVAGLVVLGLRQWRLGRRRPAFVLALGVLALACLPLVALLRRPPNPYPVYKITLTCGPLFALGLGVLLPRLRVPLLLLVATCTGLMACESAWHRHSPYPHVRSMIAGDYRWAERQIGELGAAEVCLAVEPRHHATWLSYSGRHHRLWLLPTPADASPPPAAAYLLVERGFGPETAGAELVAERGRFSLWRRPAAPGLAALLAPP